MYQKYSFYKNKYLEPNIQFKKIGKGHNQRFGKIIIYIFEHAERCETLLHKKHCLKPQYTFFYMFPVANIK